MDARFNLREYLDAIAGCKIRLSQEEEVRLAKLAETGDLGARDSLIESQLPYVVKIAHWFSKRSTIPLEDLIQYGNLGLMHAVSKFDWRKGFRLSTYCTWWIRQRIFNQCAVDGLIHLPRSAKGGKLLEDREKCRKIGSLSAGFLTKGIWSEETYAEMIPDRQAIPIDVAIDREEYLLGVRQTVDRLPDRLRSILVLRVWDGYTLEQVGQIHGVTKERIRELEVKAKRMFKDYYTRDQLQKKRLKVAG